MGSTISLFRDLVRLFDVPVAITYKIGVYTELSAAGFLGITVIAQYNVFITIP